jgi:hypothetical protein
MKHQALLLFVVAAAGMSLIGDFNCFVRKICCSLSSALLFVCVPQRLSRAAPTLLSYLSKLILLPFLAQFLMVNATSNMLIFCLLVFDTCAAGFCQLTGAFVSKNRIAAKASAPSAERAKSRSKEAAKNAKKESEGFLSKAKHAVLGDSSSSDSEDEPLMSKAGRYNSDCSKRAREAKAKGKKAASHAKAAGADVKDATGDAVTSGAQKVRAGTASAAATAAEKLAQAKDAAASAAQSAGSTVTDAAGAAAENSAGLFENVRHSVRESAERLKVPVLHSPLQLI